MRNAIVVLAALCAITSARACTRENGSAVSVTDAEARRLAYLALPANARSLPGLTFDTSGNRATSKCLVVDDLWDNRKGSPHIAFYSVDRRTAEVWTPLDCRRVTGRALKTFQKSVRKRMGVSEAERKFSIEGQTCCTIE